MSDREKPELTPAGHEERRVKLYVTVEEWQRARWKTFVAFALVSVAAAAGLYLAVHANTETKENGADAVLRSCASRAELRITVATALDDLRRLAITHASRREVAAFLVTTQPPIDALLSQAAGRPVHASPPTPLPLGLLAVVRGRALVRCEAEAAAFRTGSSVSNTD